MSRHAFFITGDRVVPVANAAGAGFQYQAQAHVLLPQVQIGPHRHEHSETVIVVSEGTLEVMVNGMASLVGAGSFVRIAPGTWFAYRNAGEGPARVLCRTAPQQARRHGLRVTIHLTAA
jgi:mannose-6-phosphate isomerase-like protein (cupin superfamily)